MPVETCRIPSKVFLLGEYHALLGGSALVAACRPFFLWTPDQEEPPMELFGPLQKLRDRYGLSGRGNWTDPHEGVGGWGSSTAKYLALSQEVEPPIHLARLWHEFREDHPKNDVIPSGLDLVVQRAGTVLFWPGWEDEPDFPDMNEIEVLDPPEGFDLQFFQASHLPNRKTNSYKEIQARKYWLRDPKRLDDRERWNDLIERAVDAWKSGDGERFGRCLNHFAEDLYDRGLESDAAGDDRLWFYKQRQVYGVKGCGAQLSDTIVAATFGDPTELIRLAQIRGLHYLGDQRLLDL